MHSTKEEGNKDFTGEILVTQINGEFITGYLVDKGAITHKLSKGANSNKFGSTCEIHDDWDAACYLQLTQEDVIITAPSGSGGEPIQLREMYPPDGGDDPYYGPEGFDYNSSGGVGAFTFNLNEMIFDEGDKPLEEYDEICIGISRVWQLSQQNGDEYAAVLTSDGAVLITQQLDPNGGGISGIYSYNGTTYYQYPTSQGSPSRTYSGQLTSSGRYFIPIVATMHSHTPCINDGTNGISNNTINDDQNFANYYITLTLIIIL